MVGGTLNGLGVIRSLSRARVPVFLLETTRQCPAAWSRYCVFIYTPSLEGDELIASLARLASELGCQPVLLLTSDQSVITVSAHREQISSLYHLGLPAPDVVNALVEKSAFQRLAQQEGFSIPRGLSIYNESDLARLGELLPPLIIKPADKRLVLAGLVERAVRVVTIAQAQALAARMLPRASPLIVQEWVEGPDTEIFFTLFSCDRDGNIIGLFPGRKLVCSPPAVGSTAVCIAAPEAADELYEETRCFTKRVAYQGLGGLEFKRDARTGRFVIIEPTVGRTDWQEEIATLCGVNLPLLAYRAALGRCKHAIYEGGSADVLWRSSKGFRLPADSLTRHLRIIDGYFRWSDLGPAIYYYGYECFAKRVWRRAHGIIHSALELIAREH